MLKKLSGVFATYKEESVRIHTNIKYWQSFIHKAIESFEPDQEDRLLYASRFFVRDIDPGNGESSLLLAKDSFSLQKNDLKSYNDSFFRWIMNLSISHLYSAVENALLRAIQVKFFPQLEYSESKGKDLTRISFDVVNYLKQNGIEYDTKNSRHLMTFLRTNLIEFEQFISLNYFQNVSGTWEHYFEIFSYLRNIVVHNSMRVSQQNANALKSINKGMVKYFFELHNGKVFLLTPRDTERFLYFVSCSDVFVSNTIKIIASQEDMSFLHLETGEKLKRK